tara:strand:- start:398 stop:616 length:219 start_codon:yes stop_codon:yes gene_type:complete
VLGSSLCFLSFLGGTQQAPPAAAVVRKQVDGFLRENAAVARDIESRTIARENSEWMFRITAVPRVVMSAEKR